MFRTVVMILHSSCPSYGSGQAQKYHAFKHAVVRHVASLQETAQIKDDQSNFIKYTAGYVMELTERHVRVSASY